MAKAKAKEIQDMNLSHLSYATYGMQQVYYGTFKISELDTVLDYYTCSLES